MTIKWNGREVTRQPQRAMVAGVAFMGGAAALVFVPLMLAVIVPLSLPWHGLLRLIGHRGFTKDEGRNTLSYEVPWWGMVLSLAPVVLLLVAVL